MINIKILDSLFNTSRLRMSILDLTIDFAIALDGVDVLLENKNLVFLGTLTEYGYELEPFATGTWNYHRSTMSFFSSMMK